MKNIVVLKDINKTYINGDKRILILNSISMSVEKGEIISIEGCSGSGKSTLLNIIGLLDKWDSGELYIDNEIITDKEKNNELIRKDKIGFIFQFHHLFPEFTVFENLLIPQMLFSTSNSKKYKNANYFLEILGLEHIKNKYPAQISGGEKQRVAIARAIINKPDLILADEPTGNLDLDNGNNILELIQKINKNEKITFIIATHDPEVSKIANKNLYLNNTKLTQNIKEV